ncbi:TetR/AcrR family transcriptional regulator C-terminal domain-containing protein [Amycolatopsis keratiniphila]|uniref:TetR/AcrR family transcriptional regulator C-terminal domain-containing protein n=1 Tax=Amycolatopsis keratiniphila TaxID=129921 RepID=UPI00087D7475|nr:TetR/AcrR family transcriptional regulator C-terminal domain-containing protein [Amycolatopsis keratiniphila]OLZ61699.1 TetR family transcriptional regulator [Amycolatopsis keratiniphila subsp. nogabecina]SDU16713.1 regulatory protein, tetR family [Amycolatopsis keratiniphila]
MAEDDAQPDPERAIELLWGTSEPERPGLSLGRIVAAAVEVADAEGLSSLSMRKVAERFGTTTMSLYRYVPGKAELVELMRDAVYGEFPMGSSDGLGWRAGLERWARRAWEMHHRHPWLVHSAGSRRLPGPNIMAGYDHALDVASRSGLAPAEVIAVVNLVGGFVESAARQAGEAAELQRRTGVTHERWWSERESLFERLDRYPALERLWKAGGMDAPLDAFEFGLRRTLDGIEALVRSQGSEVISDETGGGECVVCGKPLDGGGRGRPRDYCSRACQQRAYRRRQARSV